MNVTRIIFQIRRPRKDTKGKTVMVSGILVVPVYATARDGSDLDACVARAESALRAQYEAKYRDSGTFNVNKLAVLSEDDYAVASSLSEAQECI